MIQPKNDLALFRVIMVFASFSPVFLIWAIIGMDIIRDQVVIPVCLILAICPHIIIYCRIKKVLSTKSWKSITIETAKDSSEHLLTYFLPLALPIMFKSFSSVRELVAILLLYSTMVFVSWHLRIYYVNIVFALFGYRFFTISQPPNKLSHGLSERILITNRIQLTKGLYLNAANLGGNIYFEIPKKLEKTNYDH